MANRKTSLDRDIKNGIPNDLGTFIASHKNLDVICFNGTKVADLFEKHFISRLLTI